MSSDFTAWGERRFGRFNTLGVWTLYKKEVLRFIKVLGQTVAAPVIQSLLFLVVMSVIFGDLRSDVNGVPFAAFIAPGLIMMQILQNSFANTSSSLLVSKVQGNIVDFLMPPLSATELTAAFAAGGMTRGVAVAIVSWFAMVWFAPLSVHNFVEVAFYAIGASLMLSFLGIIGGIWSEKFDHLATITTFIIMPATFLSGTFYSVTQVPEQWQWIIHLNPVFYLIDGFRAGFIGQSDSDAWWIGVAVVIGLNIVLAFVCHHMFKRGYNLKA